MSLKLVTELNDTDRSLLHRSIDGFVPEAVFDVHTHLFHSRHFAAGNRPVFLDEDRGYGMPDFQAAMQLWLPGRRVEGLFFGYPSAGNDRAGENAWVQSQVDASTNSRALVLAAPTDDQAEVRRLLSTGVFVGIKPYRLYADVPDTKEAEIESFAPEWMWELCHEHDGIMMLHIMLAGGITDPRNVASIRRLCRRYPRCKLVLAHVARSFNYRHAREGLHHLVDLDNVVVDTSAVTQAGAFLAALEILGPRRVLWGSDYMVSELRGSCITQGDGFTWIHPEITGDKLTIFGQYTTVGIESLLCLREACEDTGMTQGDLEDIFRENALRLLKPAPASPSGPQLWEEAKTKISCGTGLLSKRAHLFDPQSWPSYFSRAKGAYIWDLDDKRYTDFTGGVGAILLGHADDEVNAAVKRRVNLGSYATLASPDEVKLADVLLGLHPWAGKVRYARGGGEALGLAVRIARAATGKSGIAFCGYHGWSDWYLAANLGDDAALDGHLLPGLQPLGVPRELAGTAVPFRYNDPASFQSALQKLDGKLAAVVMEPMRSELPRDGFLQHVIDACHAAGAVYVLDEVTSGWRFGFPGAAPGLGIEPDISVYAKAMSNGYPAGAIVGKNEVMDAANSSFISSSYWTDGVGTAASLACIRKMQREGVQQQVWQLGERLQSGLREVAARHPALQLKVGGMPCAPSLAFANPAAKQHMIRHMLQRGFLMSSQLYVTWSHTEAMVAEMLAALDESLAIVANTPLELAQGPQQGFARLV
ncbi:MAG: aminotransferase class III-fold pyridoxal phosphate-dependent enzyme [Prosthecobacter sp.]|uniref:aminotransferase class III-fold pyridoxal phosphate-dependent enzyme n=1 Tax=Prosthecobacter sp. TaxID=1965333 RepID=UPI0025E1B474|nr:aminotransferase class III-fold pyridoxal phosphate-dependent enzyme [Prosthecobacter sp.]MCF7788208.1 aminotransferase class III-fold pyridoxal phosphate-dependent enzyme [Prosthecobacter sp.]